MVESEWKFSADRTDWLISNELAELERAYESPEESGEILGVPAHCLLGAEIDFTIKMNKPTLEQVAALEASRKMITVELSLLVPKDDEQERRKADWLEQVPNLTSEELINYQIYRRLSVPTLDPPDATMYLNADESPETTLEFIFGNGLYQTGYYDNPGYFEMRTQAAKPTIAIERIRRAKEVGEEVARSYGAKLTYEGDQTSFSVWTLRNNEWQPIHSLDNPEGQEIARRATAGMLYALRDSRVVLDPPYPDTLPAYNQMRLVASPERVRTPGGALRVIPERIEQGQTVGTEDFELAALVRMSGFAYGVIDEVFDTSFVRAEPQDLLVPGPEYLKVRDLHFLRGLQASERVNGRFVLGDDVELDWERRIHTLSGIIGTEVYERRDSTEIIRKLLGCISLSSDGVLTADEDSFNEILAMAEDHYIDLEGAPSETITERLQRRIQCLRDRVIIQGSVDSEWPAGVAFHRDLEEIVTAPSLRYIGRPVLEAISQELAGAFTHSEAVASYYFKTIVNTAASVHEKLVELQEMTNRFPDANPDEVLQLIQEQLRHKMEVYLGNIIGYSAAGTPAEAYDDLTQEYAKDLELLQALTERE